VAKDVERVVLLGMNEVMRRTGLTRRQLRYLEDRELIGVVERLHGRRGYRLEQVDMLESLGRLRQIGVGLDEAAKLASASPGHAVGVKIERVAALLSRAQRETQARARTSAELCVLLEGLLAADAKVFGAG
jgi:DNA-binding transcriptional MerR regulator